MDKDNIKIDERLIAEIDEDTNIDELIEKDLKKQIRRKMACERLRNKMLNITIQNK